MDVLYGDQVWLFHPEDYHFSFHRALPVDPLHTVARYFEVEQHFLRTASDDWLYVELRYPSDVVFPFGTFSGVKRRSRRAGRRARAFALGEVIWRRSPSVLRYALLALPGGL